MRKSKALEITTVVLLLGGALTYQIMREAAVKKSIVPEKVPLLADQTVKVEEVIPKEEPEQPKVKSLTEKVEEFLLTLKSEKVEPYNPHLSTLGVAPDWADLDKYQKSITKADFMRLLTTVYAVGDSWKQWIKIQDDHALITTHAGNVEAEPYKLMFSVEQSVPVVKSWREASQLGETQEDKPLGGLVVAIDAGHLGGEKWAVIEERNFAVHGDEPVREGVITLKVAKMLKRKLELLGAEVVLVRKGLDPLNPKRPEHYTHKAYEELVGKGLVPSGPAVEALRKKMFYRVGEIRTRADLVNLVIKPDVVLCLHFNAESWGDPENPELVDEGHFHVLLHGAFTEGELAKDDERFSMLKKILMRNHDEEVGLAKEVAAASVKLNKLPAYLYKPDSKRAKKVLNNDYLWARNLLANRLYECPVVYMEPYVMNSKVDYARIQMGDYDGLVNLDGVEYPSIFREYADGVANGLEKYYREKRGLKTTPVASPVEEEE